LTDPDRQHPESIRRSLRDEPFYAAFMESVQDAIMITDFDSARIVDANRAAVRIYGRSVEDLQTMVGRHLHPEHAGPQVTELSRGLHERGAGYTPRLEVKRPDGQIVWVEFTLSVFHVGGHKLVISVGRDISAQVEHQRALEAARDEAIRTANAQQRLAAMGQLTTGVAHDFNNLLAVMSSTAEIVREDTGPGHPHHEALDDLGEAVSVASDLAQQLMSFAQLEDDRARTVDLKRFLPRCGRLVTRVVEDHVRVDWQVDPATSAVRIDPARLYQIVLNLAVNARDALSERAGTIVLSATPCPEGSAIEVCDDGPGIAPEIRDTLFEPFRSTKRGSSAGLGLSVARGIARDAGGDLIWVPTPEGAVFRLTLPRSHRQEETPIAGVERGSGHGHVLIVDDRALVRRTLERILVRRGYRVDTAGSGAEGLDVLRAARPDVLLADVAMPDMVGPELARRARLLYADLAIVFMSGHAAPEKLGLKPGAPFVRKPFRTEDVLEALRKAMS